MTNNTSPPPHTPTSTLLTFLSILASRNTTTSPVSCTAQYEALSGMRDRDGVQYAMHVGNDASCLHGLHHGRMDNDALKCHNLNRTHIQDILREMNILGTSEARIEDLCADIMHWDETRIHEPVHNATHYLPTNCINVCAKSEQKPSKREQRKLQAYLKLIAQQENDSGAAASSSSATVTSTTKSTKSSTAKKPKNDKNTALALLADATTKKNEKKRKRSSAANDGSKQKKKKTQEEEHDSDYDTDSEEIMPDPELEDRVKLFSYVKQYLIDWKLDMNQPLAITPKFPAKIGKKKLLDSYLAQDRSHLVGAEVENGDVETNDDYAIISEDDEDEVVFEDEEEDSRSKKKKKTSKKKKTGAATSGGGGLMGIKIPKKKKNANQWASTPTSAVTMTPTSVQNTPVQPSQSLDFPLSAKSTLTSSPQPSETSSASTPTIATRIPKPPIVGPDADPVSHLVRWCQQHHYNINFRTEKCPNGFRVRVLLAGLLPAVFTPHWEPTEQDAQRKACLIVIDQLWKMHTDGPGTPTPTIHNAPYHADPYGSQGNGPPPMDMNHHRRGMSPPSDKSRGLPPARGGAPSYPDRGAPITAYGAGGRGAVAPPPPPSSGVYPPQSDRGAPMYPDRRHYSAEPSRGYSPGPPMYPSNVPPPSTADGYNDRGYGQNAPPHPGYAPHGRPDPRGHAPDYPDRRHMPGAGGPSYPGEPLPPPRGRAGSPGYPDRGMPPRGGRYPSPDYGRKERDPYARPPSGYGGRY